MDHLFLKLLQDTFATDKRMRKNAVACAFRN